MANETLNEPPERLTCALLTTFRHDWAAEIVTACPGFDVVTIDPSLLGLGTTPNPLGLRLETRADAVIVSNIWIRWLTENHGVSAHQVLGRLERLGGVLVGLDSADDFSLGFRPPELTPFEVVLKPQGVYRDRDLYNYAVGAWFPGANWTQKVQPRESRFRDKDLEKIRLSVPCFMTEFPPIRKVARAREQGLSASARRPLSLPEQTARDLADRVFMRLLARTPLSGPVRPMDVHCVLSLTHIQRLEALQALEGYGGMRGIIGVPDFVAGVTRREDWSVAAHDAVHQAAQPYSREPIGRARYFLRLARHRIVVSPAGYGEVCFRHAEAMLTGATLVCQDLSHVEMMYPIVDGRNAVFCRPDLSDLRKRVDYLLNAEDERRTIARRGRASLIQWSRDWRKHLYDGIERHVRHAIS